MRYILIISLCFTPLFIQAQEEHNFNNEIGINLTYNPIDGMATTFRYRKDFTNAGVLKFELNSNWNNTFIGRIGYEFLQLRLGRFELGTGIDLKYKNKDFTEIGSLRYQELSVELPIELRYRLSNKFSIYSGISFSERLASRNPFLGSHDTTAEIRLGLGYRF